MKILEWYGGSLSLSADLPTCTILTYFLRIFHPFYTFTLSPILQCVVCHAHHVHMQLNPFTSGFNIYFFRTPKRDYFQWKCLEKNFYPLKISLSMIRCPDNQINASFIDISRIKWLVFFIVVVLSSAQLVPFASSKAPADYQPAPGRTDGVPEEASKTMDYKSVFTNLCLELQQNRSWINGIRQKSTKEWTHSLTAVPFVRGHRSVFPSDSEKHRRAYTSSNVCHSHEWRVDTASGKTLKKRNACLHAVRHAVGKKIACIHGLRSEGINTVRTSLY